MYLSRRQILKFGVAATAAGLASPLLPTIAKSNSSSNLFQPAWDSLSNYQVPEWFSNAKFGIWAHWGPQCVPELGDWYARNMYIPKEWAYTYHCKQYGHPSAVGFKDIIRRWHAERWDPEHLIKLYKRAGAKYFMTMANHHDNFDNYDSKFQQWNSVNLGPKCDIVGTWERYVREAGLRFGVSVHAAHAWSWYEPSQGADINGPLAGVPYDGKLTKADGKGHWWEGFDPQALYEQRHTPGKRMVWNWTANQGSSIPDSAYAERFYNRTIDLIDHYNPDLVYFDDTVLPLHPVSDVGLRIAAHYYNRSMALHHGRNEAVITGKWLSDDQRKCLVLDMERAFSQVINPLPYQTDTCIGSWHYSRWLYDNHHYKTAETVIHMLIDTVSKNGNLMLNIPLPGHGEPDSDELGFLANLTKWMDVNSEGIYDTRPWKLFGEGPIAESKERLQDDGIKYTSQDIRFTQKKDALYAFVMAWPDRNSVTIKSLGINMETGKKKIERVEMLGLHGYPLKYQQNADALIITLPEKHPCEYVFALKIQ